VLVTRKSFVAKRFSLEEETYEFSKPIRRVTSLNPVDSYLSGSWEALGAGAPILVALAQLCSQAIVDRPSVPPLESFSPAARAILYAARIRGVIEVKGLHTAFEAPSRLLAVYIEDEEGNTIAFRDARNPEITVQFLEGLRELCISGLVIHHLLRDFSLSSAGFAMARQIELEDIQKWLAKGTEFGLHD
jgi:hypothetical protein